MLWQKRALAKAGHLSQRCSADSTSSSQSRQRSDCFSCEVQPSVVSAPETDQIRQFCLVKGVLDLVSISCVQVQEAVVAAREWSVLPMDHCFPGLLVFWSKCRSAGCGRVDPRLASESASSLPQRLQCPETQTMSNFLEQMILAMDR